MKCGKSNDHLALATWLAYEFVQIHPFLDGNGRISRLLSNMALLKGGYPFALPYGFPYGDDKAKKLYLKAIQYATNHGGDTSQLNVINLHAFRALSASFFKSFRGPSSGHGDDEFEKENVPVMHTVNTQKRYILAFI